MEKSNHTKKLVIRNYESQDLADCRQLWVELTSWHRDIYDSPSIGGDNPGLLFDEHLNRVGPDNIWVAEVNGKVVGLTGLIFEDQEAELEPIIVFDEFRGLGIGRRLVETVIQHARDSGVRQLKVLPVGRNEQAIRFFHNLGFKVIGYIELFQEFKPGEEQIWFDREKLAGRDFKV